MPNFMNRLNTAVDRIADLHPLILFSLLFSLTGCLLAHGNFTVRLICVTLACSWILSSLVFHRCRCLSVLRSGVLGICFGAALSMLLFNGYTAHLESYAGETVEIRGYVRETVYTTNYSGCYILQISEGLPRCRIVVETSDTDWEEGQIVSGRIALQILEDGKDGAFDERTYYFSQGTVLSGENIDCTPTGSIYYAPSVLFHRMNSKLSSLLDAHVQGDGLASAVLLGNRGSLSDAAQRDFRRLGILHLLAVSGTHLAILMVFSEKTLIYLHIRPRKRLAIQAVLCIGYMALTGFSASVVRAGLMHLLLIVCKFLNLKLKYFNALVLSCTAILVFSPYAVLDAGLHLSFLATAGCLIHIHLATTWKPLKEFISGNSVKSRKRSPLQQFFRKIRKEFCSILVMTAIISLLMMPLSWLYFGELSLLGFVIGIFYIPAISLLMYISILYLLLYPLGIFILPLAKVISLYTAFLLDTASVISRLPHITLSLHYPFMLFFFLPIFLCILLLPLVRYKGRCIICIGGLFSGMLITVLFFHLFTAQNVNVIYRNIQKNDGFVLQSGTQVILADSSDGSYTFTGYLLHEAKSVYATELYGYWPTHYHERHVATFEKISDNWILRNLFLTTPQNEKEEGIYNSLIACAQRKGIRVILLDENPLLFKGLTVEAVERVYLSRSTHPVTGFSLVRDKERITYVSSSWNEGYMKIMPLLSDSQGIIFGSHSPVYKKNSDLTLVKPEWIVWNGESHQWIQISTDCSVPQLFDCGRLVYRFP